MRLLDLVSEEPTTLSRRFDAFIVLMIIFSLITFSVETIPNLDGQVLEILKWAEVVVVIIFTAEYLLRLVAAPNKPAFIFSFYGIIDLLAVLPFYLTTGLDLRSVRIFRCFRLFRILKLLRYSRALNHIKDAFYEIREELVLYLVSTGFLLYLAAVGIYYFEHEAQPEAFSSVFACLWWSVITFTTVGYGDVYPITVGGRVFTFLVLMIGLGVIAVPSGLIASALTKTFDQRQALKERNQPMVESSKTTE